MARVSLDRVAEEYATHERVVEARGEIAALCE